MPDPVFPRRLCGVPLTQEGHRFYSGERGGKHASISQATASALWRASIWCRIDGGFGREEPRIDGYGKTPQSAAAECRRRLAKLREMIG